jgi:hypothetical protein
MAAEPPKPQTGAGLGIVPPQQEPE